MLVVGRGTECGVGTKAAIREELGEATQGEGEGRARVQRAVVVERGLDNGPVLRVVVGE